MGFKTDLFHLSSLRLLLGAGVGFLFFGIVNLFANMYFAIGFLFVGVTLIVISVVGHRRFGERAIQR